MSFDNPLLNGAKLAVGIGIIPSDNCKIRKAKLRNSLPLSVRTLCGGPNFAIQCSANDAMIDSFFLLLITETIEYLLYSSIMCIHNFFSPLKTISNKSIAKHSLKFVDRKSVV